MAQNRAPPRDATALNARAALVGWLEWGSGGTRLSHGRSKTERVELGAVNAARPLSETDPAVLHVLAPKGPAFWDFSAVVPRFGAVQAPDYVLTTGLLRLPASK